MRSVDKLVAIALVLFGTVAFVHADEHSLGGGWTKKNYSIKGNWSIVTTDEGEFLELNEKFKTRRAPDLKLFLSPLPADELNDDNALKDSVLISQLRSNKGAQRYRLPDGTDLAGYQSLVLHCEKFSKLWGVSELVAVGE